MTHDILRELDKLARTSRNAKDATGDTLDLYAEELADLPPELVVRAIQECRRSETFFPALSEIRKRVVAIAGEAVLVDEAAAWGEVMREVRRVGANPMPVFRDGVMHPAPSPAFSSPMIARAVESIGFKDICMTDIEQMGTLRAQFRDALKAIQRREIDRVVSGRYTVDRALADGTTDPMAVFSLPERNGKPS